MLVSMRRNSIGECGAAVDTVIFGAPIPPGGKLTQINFQFSTFFATRQATDIVLAYGLGIYVLPVLDPDAGGTYDAIWDTLVPKDELQADDALDLDTGVADTTAEFEPGQMNLNAVLGIGVADVVEVFKRRTFIDPSSSGMAGIHWDTDKFYYWPSDSFRTKISKQVRVEQPAVVLVGMSSPVTSSSTTTLEPAPTKQEWGMMMFLESTLEDMMKLLIGLPEAGAESPYVEASQFLADLLEPLVYESTGRAADLVSTGLNYNAKATFQVVMPGTKTMSNLTSE